MQRGSPGNHQFSQVPSTNIERSTFDRSHTVKTTFDAGKLIPVYVDEVLPGDTFKCRINAFARMATPLKPVMDDIFLDVHFFAVPYRIIWENFPRFMGEQPYPEASTDYLTPTIRFRQGAPTPPPQSLFDYFGIPPDIEPDSGPDADYAIYINNLYGRAYNLIWNEWYRDQNLQQPAGVDTDDGPDDINTYLDVLPRGKRHDYFTSALPWPQKGPDVSLVAFGPGTFPVQGLGAIGTEANPPSTTPRDVLESTDELATYNSWWSGSNISFEMVDSVLLPPGEIKRPNVYVSLSEAVATSINAFREAFQLQRLYERDARGGTRYTEIIRSHFGVISPDARLQRPEFLGGGSTRINVHPLAQTSETLTGTPQGNLAAFATAGMSGPGFVKSFTEHCVVLGLMSVRTQLTYQEGLHKMFTRRTRFDYYWPALSHLGEQAVLNREIFLTTFNTDLVDGLGNTDVFGYQERFAEYRYKPSMITGKFRSSVADSLDVWHLAQEFGEMPTLSPEFIVENPPMERILAVTDEPQFLLDAFIDLKCTRPMPVYGVPGLIDHF